MRAWLIGAFVMAVGGAGFLLLRDDDSNCGRSSTVYDGTVLPGGAATADEALASFLSVVPVSAGTGKAMPDHPDEYERVETASGGVTFSAGHLTLSASKQPNGWMIGSAETRC